MTELQRFDSEAVYEVGMQLGAYFHGCGFLSDEDFEAFQGNLKDESQALVGGLNEGVNDWINTRV